jgi:hypothetical protein
LSSIYTFINEATNTKTKIVCICNDFLGIKQSENILLFSSPPPEICQYLPLSFANSSYLTT